MVLSVAHDLKAPKKDTLDAGFKKRRQSTARRQLNESFCSPDGSFSITKTIGVFTMIVLLCRLGNDFDTLVDTPESLALILICLICPELLKKLMAMKYGGSAK